MTIFSVCVVSFCACCCCCFFLPPPVQALQHKTPMHAAQQSAQQFP
eukprot:CAMPEP_0119132392 /NCGR_PEP_ID=MMETSP1310-20130426/11816_1 /TAXON_ID=464262 /ORGANISM="Genus nov. species nov., Strain RCC2339" /LENGTH=45 /DNA_ID= /DNA_START= /DNA_END= /DNA_ORIENTATION=